MNTQSFQESFELLNQFLSDMNAPTLSERVAKTDWGITGGEAVDELKMWASDYASDVHSENCEAKQSWRYENYPPPNRPILMASSS